MKSLFIRYFLLTLVFCFLHLLALAQSPTDSLTTDDYEQDLFTAYPFLNETKNELYLPSKSELSTFFNKLKALENNQGKEVHIVHIGDSHIQADLFSGKIRTLFKEDIRFPMHSRGFVFPYRLAKTNNPINYQVRYSGQWEGKKSSSNKHSSNWGFSGINAITQSISSMVSINPNKELVDYDIKKVKVFYPTTDSKNFKPVVSLDSGNLITSSVIGDGFIEYTLMKPQESIKIEFKKVAPEQNQFMLQGIVLESETPGVTYSASGVNGAEIPSYFRCQDFNKQLAQINPDLVIISLGTNDAFVPNFDKELFRQNYRRLVADIRKVLPNVDILLTTAADNYRRRRPNKNMEVAAQQVNLLAKEMNLAVWDLYQVMGGAKSIKSWREQGLCAGDMLHFSKKGYEIQGELFFQALDMAYEQYCHDVQH